MPIYDLTASRDQRTRTGQYTPVKDLLSRRGIKWGAETTFGQRAANPFEDEVILRHCNVVTNGSNQLLKNIQPSKGVYSFAAADAFTAWLNLKNIEEHQGGHLIWHGLEPQWLIDITDPVALRAVLEDHIATVVGHFPTVKSWNVVNELLYDYLGAPGGWRNTHFYQVLGTSFPQWAFAAARAAARPGVKLIYNTNHIEDVSSTNFDNNLTLLRSLLQSGAPIDMFGTQMHLLQGPNASPAEIADRLGQISALGLDLCITELDVTDNGSAFPIASRRLAQAGLVGSILAQVVQNPRLRWITCWGVSDQTSWLGIPANGGTRTDGLPGEWLPVDRGGLMKPEWHRMLSGLA